MKKSSKKRENRFDVQARRHLQFNRLIKKRMVSQFFIIGLAFLFLFIWIIGIIVTDGEKYSKIVLSQNVGKGNSVAHKRGDIVDINGTVLATSIRVYNVILEPKTIFEINDNDKREKVINEIKGILEELFDIESEKIQDILDKKSESLYQVLLEEVSYSDYLKFQELKSSKYKNISSIIWFEEDYIRSYPYNSLASGIIGFINSYDTGEGGIEESYNELLTGSDGREYVYYSDFSKNTIVKEAENGATIVSTIDQTLQGIVEDKVLEFNEEYEDNYEDGLGTANTAVVITNPNTGAILASVSYPNFDLNNPTDLSQYFDEEELAGLGETGLLSNEIVKVRNNYITNELYEAGSTIKPFTVAAALESGTIDGTETYNCTGSLKVANYTIRCANRDGHGVINVEQCLAYSCNVAMMEMAAAMGVEVFTDAQKNFGFGPTTGSDLPGEKSTMSQIYTADNMGVTDLATNSFGQNFYVTMLQMMAGTGALVNGGNYYKPYVVQQVMDENNRVISNTEPTLVRKIVSENTVDIIREGMRGVVEYGTGKRAAVEGYDVGGKTGTAEKLPRGNGKYLVSFIGAVPISDPEILIYVIVDEANSADQGGTSFGAILAGRILEEALPYLGISKKE